MSDTSTVDIAHPLQLDVISNDSDAVTIRFNEVRDALQYTRQFLTKNMPNGTVLRPLAIITDVDETLLTHFESERQLDHDEPRDTVQGEPGRLILRRMVIDLIQYLMDEFASMELWVCSARPMSSDAVDSLTSELELAGMGDYIDPSRVKIYPADFPANQTSVFEESVCTFKELHHQGCCQMSTCVLKVGDRCWDVMSQEMMRRINREAGIDMESPECKDTFVVLQNVTNFTRACIKLPMYTE